MASATFVYIFGKAGLLKVIEDRHMIDGMQSIGFGLQGSLLIGWIEVLGAAIMLAGIRYPALRISAMLFLWPVAIGALAIHISRHDPLGELYESLIVTILPSVMLLTTSGISVRFNP